MILRDAYFQQFYAIHPFDSYKTQVENSSEFKLPAQIQGKSIVDHISKNFKRRSFVIDQIYKIGDGCKLSSFSIHAAIRYLDFIYAILYADS